jgi:hypothetical protein
MSAQQPPCRLAVQTCHPILGNEQRVISCNRSELRPVQLACINGRGKELSGRARGGQAGRLRGAQCTYEVGRGLSPLLPTHWVMQVVETCKSMYFGLHLRRLICVNECDVVSGREGGIGRDRQRPLSMRGGRMGVMGRMAFAQVRPRKSEILRANDAMMQCVGS